MGVPQPPIRPFKIHFPEQKVSDMKASIKAAVIPDTLDDEDAGAGLRMADYKTLLQYWQTRYNWEDQEKSLNQLAQFQTEIQGIDLHFIHERSRFDNATPIIILHGWPSSPFEYRKVIPQLTSQKRCDDAFHVVAPSLPGFIFSRTIPGLDYTKMATLFLMLMERLGYERFIIYGADFSNPIASIMASQDAGKHCIGLHLQGSIALPRFSIWTPFSSIKNFFSLFWSSTAYEKLKRRLLIRNQLTESAYLMEHCTKPRTMGLAVAQSPVAAGVWIAEKIIAWTDSTGIVIEDDMTEDERMELYPRKLDITKTRLEHCKVSMDEMLTTITLFWLSESLPTSMWLYRNSLVHNTWALYTDTEVTKVPVALSEFACEIMWTPFSWFKQQYHHAVQHKFHANGGHFPAQEQPDDVVSDMIDFSNHIRLS